MCADEVNMLSAIEMLTRQTLTRKMEQDFEPEHRVPDTDASGQVVKKPKTEEAQDSGWWRQAQPGQVGGER